MRKAALVLFLIALLPAFAFAQNGRQLTIDLAQKNVNITTGFTGASLSLFGVKKQPGDIAVVIRGPDRQMIVRRKGQLAGVWMNAESVNFRNVPVYYDLAVSRSERDIAAQEVLDQYHIGLDAINFEHVGREDDDTVESFKEALIRNKQTQGHFPLKPKNIVFLDDNFFRANFYMPANVPTGEYTIKTYLFGDGKVLDVNETQLRVAQVGGSARLYRFAHEDSLAYGLAAVLLAIVAGGAAYMFLRRE